MHVCPVIPSELYSPHQYGIRGCGIALLADGAWFTVQFVHSPLDKGNLSFRWRLLSIPQPLCSAIMTAN